MSGRWFHVPDLAADQVELSPAEGQHATRVLRLAPGDELTLFDGRGTVARAALTTLGGKRTATIARITDRVLHTRPVPRITLIAPGAKGDRFDWMLEKCTELGVAEFLLTGFARSVVRATLAHQERLHRAAVEACKQCRRPWLPGFQSAPALAGALDRVAGARLLYGAPAADPMPPLRGAERIALVVGPEGGLSPEECDLLEARGAAATRIGPHTLRVETAAMALVAAAWSAL